MEIILIFKFACDFLASAEQKRLIKTFALLVDIDGHYMYMVTVNVLVLIHYPRLLSESQFIKVLTGQDFKILIGEFIFGVRIK